MRISITAVRKEITAYGGQAIYLVSFLDEENHFFPDKKVWCKRQKMCCGVQMDVIQMTEDDFKQL